MLKYSDAGLYDLTDYNSVFYFSVRFGNPLKFNLDKLEKRIIMGMKKGKAQYIFQDSIDFYLYVDQKSEHKDRLLRIKEAAIQINNEININKQNTDSDRLEKLCYKNFEEFHREISESNNQYYSTSIFKAFNANTFSRFFLTSNGETKWKIIRFLENRYRNNYAELKDEIDFLTELKDKLIKKTNRLPKNGLTKFIYNEHLNTLSTAVDKLSRMK